ncbi:MAG TPA: helix-turn-helix transcriptional regulator [Candidatus Micrarchaeia archaeon]|nr:helix-turn-helix transcriptional regulator [Candidatus Micrarchaeia archaeon]
MAVVVRRIERLSGESPATAPLAPDELRQLIYERGHTLESFARLAGVDPETVSRYVRGVPIWPTTLAIIHAAVDRAPRVTVRRDPMTGELIPPEWDIEQGLPRDLVMAQWRARKSAPPPASSPDVQDPRFRPRPPRRPAPAPPSIADPRFREAAFVALAGWSGDTGPAYALPRMSLMALTHQLRAEPPGTRWEWPDRLAPGERFDAASYLAAFPPGWRQNGYAIFPSSRRAKQLIAEWRAEPLGRLVEPF